MSVAAASPRSGSERSRGFGSQTHAGPLAETGLVGLSHARAGQGRWEAVKALAALYTSRFPGGRRGAEMEALAARAGAP